jgi:hypothetical protein
MLMHADKLQDAGMIGRIVILDRPGMERAACECYGAIRRRSDAIQRNLDQAA